MEQLLAHLVGDFLFQSDWMALNKKKPGNLGDVACFIHSWMYTIPFVLLTHSFLALFIIGWTHFFIDRGYIASWLTWLKNWIAIKWIVNDNDELVMNRPWSECKGNFGFDPSRPLMIVFPISVVVDNTLHLLINYGALTWMK